MDADDTVEEVQGVMMHGAAAVSRAAEVMIRSRQDQKMRQSLQTARTTEDLQRRAEAQAQAAESFFTKAADPQWVKTAAPDDVAAAWKGAQQWREIDPDRFDTHAQAVTGQVQTTYGVAPAAAGDDLDAAASRCAERINNQRDPRRGEREAEDMAAREQQVANREHDAENDAQDTSREQDPGGPAAQDAAAHHDSATDAQQASDRHSAAADGAGLDAEADYDTPQRREATDKAMRDAGVPDEARNAWTTADQLNGQHPRTAVTKRSKTGRRKARQTHRQAGSERTR